MEPFAWDETKRQSNLDKHGVDFHLIERFEWNTALTRRDARVDYGEMRFVSAGKIEQRLYVAVWIRQGEGCRLISLRKANVREKRLYDKS